MATPVVTVVSEEERITRSLARAGVPASAIRDVTMTEQAEKHTLARDAQEVRHSFVLYNSALCLTSE